MRQGELGRLKRLTVGRLVFALIFLVVIVLGLVILFDGKGTSELIGKVGFVGLLLGILGNAGQLLQQGRLLNAHLQQHEESAKVATQVAKQAVETAQKTTDVVEKIAQKVNST